MTLETLIRGMAKHDTTLAPAIEYLDHLALMAEVRSLSLRLDEAELVNERERTFASVREYLESERRGRVNS